MAIIFNQDLLDILEKSSKEHGFLDFGIAKIEHLNKEINILKERITKGYTAEMQYLANNLDKRENPTKLLEGSQSIIVFLAPYSKRRSLRNIDNPKIASYAYGIDYHWVIKEKLQKIIDLIKIHEPEFIARPFTDSAPILERKWAVRAGLGFIGKNTMLISKKHGNRTLIGSIICNLEIDPKITISEISKHHSDIDNCSNCNKCIESCPNNAIIEPYTLDARKCISYQTIESKRLAKDEEYLINRRGWIFGCEECLINCPWYNKGVDKGWEEFGHNQSFLEEINFKTWLELNNSEFKKKFSNSPLLRSGLKKIKDNIRYDRKITD